MRFTVARDNIHKAIQNVVGVVPSKTTTPILGDILFELEKDKLKLTATDLEILISTTINVDGAQNGVIAIPAKFLNEIIRELGNEKILFEQEDGYRIKLTTERGEYRIVGDPGDDFPLMLMEEDMSNFEIQQRTAQRMIDKCIFAVSHDELRPALMGVLFQISSGELKLVGTDGHRLSRIIKKDFDFIGEDAELIVPTKALSLLSKNIDQSENLLKIEFSKNYIIFNLENLRIYSRLVDSEYPDYEGVIPDDNKKEVFADTAQLLSSIRRVSIFSSTLTRQVQFSLGDGKVEISSQDIDVGGEGREKLDVEYVGDQFDIAFNAQYLLDVVRHVDTERTKILLSSPITAAVILPIEQNEGEDLLMLLMPVRLNEYYEAESPVEEEPASTDETSYSG
jgi:DNA polymerase-3 subunit beta